MDSTIARFEFRATAPKQVQSRTMPPVRLPKPTADLVNRMLAARCGTVR